MSILETLSVSDQGKLDFLTEFGVTYMRYPEFREYTKTWVLLFVNQQYIGVFPTDSSALSEGFKIGKKEGTKPDIDWIPITPTVYGEFKETHSTSGI